MAGAEGAAMEGEEGAGVMVVGVGARMAAIGEEGGEGVATVSLCVPATQSSSLGLGLCMPLCPMCFIKVGRIQGFRGGL